MARTGARVSEGVLTFDEAGLDQMVPVGSVDWERWLEQPSTMAFRFEDGTARFTARRERQRGHSYWYAYRRRGGRLRKAYLGRSSDLTLDRLMTIGDRLAERFGDTPGVASDGLPDARPVLPRGRQNLPCEISSFLGRRAETAEVRRLLTTARLLTLTGTGGVGKTRLALHVAADLLGEGAVRVWWVNLAPLADPTLVPQAVAEATGVREEPGQPLLVTLARALGFEAVLLVLDNCEHLVDACARLVEHLLRVCPDLRILATSREPLGVSGEVAWRVPSLALPAGGEDLSADDLARYEAMQLFVQRAQATRPGFALTEENAPAVLELCQRLDGIPLAIELAAARVRALTPGEIATRLGDRFRLLSSGDRTAPPRHQTLRAVVDWTYNLLTDSERRLFERLSVFAGGFTLEAAEAVCSGGAIEATEVFDLLSRLVDRSVVLAEHQGETGTTRYRLLETLRDYGQERLAAYGEADRVRERHATWLVELAQQAERAFRGPEQGRWLRRAEREHDNVRAALTWALEREEVELAVRLAAGLSWSWLLHQRWSEGLDWVGRVLALSGPEPTRERALLLLGAVQLTAFRGDMTSNRPSGNLSAVRRWVEEYLEIGETLGDDELVLGGFGLLGLLRDFGISLEGKPVLSPEELQVWARRIGHTWGECRGLEALARDALRTGNLEAAGAHLAEAVRLARGVGDTWSLAMALNQLSDVERVRGVYPRAGTLYDESLALFAQLGLGPQPNLVHNLGYVALAAGEYAGASARFAEALTQFRRLGESRGAAECLMGFGAVAAAEGRAADAAQLFGAGEAVLEASGAGVWPANRADCERWEDRARRKLSPAAFERARIEGRSLSLEHATTLMLERGAARDAMPHPAQHKPPGLTPRECEVAQLAARGLTNRQIADALVITEKTAANHLQHVLDKLDLHTRTQLAARAVEFGFSRTEPADSHA